MAARLQQLILGLGKAKQTNIATASASFLRFKKVDATVTSPKPTFEDDAAEIGKGHEFITDTFPSHYDVANHIEKYASAEFATWAIAFALGNVTQTGSVAPYTYTVVPLDPGTTLELPYFTVVEQIPEGGGSCIDNAYIGCQIEGFTYQFSYGPGRASSKIMVDWVGSGLLTSPSTVTVPAIQTESNMLAASMSLVVNGVDYVATKRILSGSLSWKNNLLLAEGFFPGSGLQNGLQVRGRMEIGARVPTFEFTARLLAGSPEYTSLVGQTTGTAVLTVSFDASHSVTFTFPKLRYKMVENTEAGGIIAVKVTCAPEFDTASGTVFSVVTKCPIAGIAQ